MGEQRIAITSIGEGGAPLQLFKVPFSETNREANHELLHVPLALRSLDRARSPLQVQDRRGDI